MEKIHLNEGLHYRETGCPMEEFEVKFFDGGYYTVRPDGIGDTIFGAFAHKVMWAMGEYGRKLGRHPHFQEKIKFIIEWSEDIANNPNGIYSKN